MVSLLNDDQQERALLQSEKPDREAPRPLNPPEVEALMRTVLDSLMEMERKVDSLVNNNLPQADAATISPLLNSASTATPEMTTVSSGFQEIRLSIGELGTNILYNSFNVFILTRSSGDGSQECHGLANEKPHGDSPPGDDVCPGCRAGTVNYRLLSEAHVRGPAGMILAA